MNVAEILSALLYEAGYKKMSKKIDADFEEDPDREVLCMEVMVWSDDVAQSVGDERQSAVGVSVTGLSHEGPTIMRLQTDD